MSSKLKCPFAMRGARNEDHRVRLPDADVERPWNHETPVT